MVLTDLILHNFRNHKNLHIKLKLGVTGIIGKNGTGKSSIIEAILFVLTGDLFNKAGKSEAITLGEEDGYVMINFELNGKKGKLQRHLDVCKTLLAYDGVIYKKATEVKELWDKLLQINPEIVGRVMIARQGSIQSLFSGEQALRERVFQKIFVVPNTEKIRKIVFDKYIKQAPPVIPIEDIIELTSSKKKKEEEIKELQEFLETLDICTEDELFNIRQQLQYIAKCENDKGKFELLTNSLGQLKEELGTLQAEYDDIVEYLSTANLEQFENNIKILLQQKAIYEQKLIIQDKLTTKLLNKPKFTHQDISDELDILVNNINNQQEQITKLSISIDTLKKVINNFTTLKDHAKCPMCNQAVKISKEEILATNSMLARTVEELAQNKELYNTSVKNKTALLKTLEHVQEYENSVNNLKEQLKNYAKIKFDQEDLTIHEEAVIKVKELLGKKNTFKLLINKKVNDIKCIEMEIASLSVYTGDENIDKLKSRLANDINQNTENIRVFQQKNVKLQVTQSELLALNIRIISTRTNTEKNNKRNKYINILNKIYDVFHTSQFPRKLILNYADIVTEYLMENLQLFSIPYVAKVADNFKIEMFDEDGRMLPSISGGQEIQVGISLHLALHDLFSQSFPLMIIDEGTTHLDEDNRKTYFNIIKGLKAKNTLKQILVIDHDSMLSDVVDQVIEIKNND